MEGIVLVCASEAFDLLILLVIRRKDYSNLQKYSLQISLALEMGFIANLIVYLSKEGTSMKNYYQILGVKQSVDEKKIKKAYRKLALKYHPNNCDRIDAESKFEEVTEAYNVLTSEEKRAKYDKKLAQYQERMKDPFAKEFSR